MLYGFNTYSKELVYGDADNRKLLESSICEWANIRGKPLEQWLIKQKWVDLTLTDEYVYPKLVKEFYETLTIVCKGSVVAKVKGVYIELNSSIVNSIFKCPDDGMKINRKGVYSHKGFNKDQFIRSIVSKPLGPVINPRLSSTLLWNSIKELEEFMGCCILPHSSYHCVLSSHNIFFMWCIVNGVQVNFGHSFIEYICDLSRNSCLPYSMLLTKIFRCFKVDFKGEKLNFVSKSFAFCGGRRVITNSRCFGIEHIDRFLNEGKGESSKVPSEESQKEAHVSTELVNDKLECPLSPGLSINSLYLSHNREQQERSKATMVYKGACTPVNDFEDLVPSQNPEIIHIASTLQNMPLQDQSQIASSSKATQNPSPQIQPPHLSLNLSPCLTQTQPIPPGFENLRNHPVYPTQQDAGRTNTGTRVTLEALMDKGRSMVFTLDSALAHTFNLYTQAKEAADASKTTPSNPQQDACFSILQELRNNLEQMNAMLADHGNTMTVLEVQICEMLQRQGDHEARMGRFEKMIAEVGKDVKANGKILGNLQAVSSSSPGIPSSSAAMSSPKNYTPYFDKK